MEWHAVRKIALIFAIVAIAIFLSLNSVHHSADAQSSGAASIKTVGDEPEDLDQISARILSGDVNERQQAMREFAAYGPEKYGANALPIIETALGSQDEIVQYFALVSIHRAAAFDTDLAELPRFRNRIMHLLESNSDEVSAQASAVATSLYSGGDSAEKILRRAMSERDLAKKAAYLRNLQPFDLNDDTLLDELIALARGPTSIVSVEAANALLRLDDPPRKLLPELIRMIQSPRYFGEYTLVKGIEQYGEQAEVYLPVLEQVRDLLQKESAIDYDSRTLRVSREGPILNVYEDPHALGALAETIEVLSKK